MSVPVPSILQTHTPFPYPILSAFPVRFPAFPHKRNNILSCPRRKRGQKPERDIILSRSFAVRIHKGTNMLPQIRFLRINGAKKGITIYPSYYVSVSERDNILSPLCTVYLCERDNIMSPLFLLRFPAYFTRGTIYCPFNTFPVIYLKGT